MKKPDHLLDSRSNCTMFRVDAANLALQDLGFFVFGPLLTDSQVERLREVHSSLSSSAVGGLRQESWHTTGQMDDPELRNEVFRDVGRIVAPAVDAVLMDGYETIAGHFHTNPSGPSGGIGPHQDVCMVNERRASSINCWIPLVDSTISNGTLRLVPGSHRFGNHDRTLALPWAYNGLHDLFWEFAEVTDVKAGHLLLFDTATIHCSGPNGSGSDRLAVNGLIVPEGAKLRYLAPVGQDEHPKVAVHEIIRESYLHSDLSELSHQRAIEVRDLELPNFDPAYVRNQCEIGRELLRVSTQSQSA